MSFWDGLPYGDIVNAGAALAGTYFTLDANKQANEAQIKLAQDKLAAEQALAAASGGGGGGGGGGAALQAAKLSNLSNLYQNWAAVRAKNADTEAQAAQMTGRLGQDPIIAALARLK